MPRIKPPEFEDRPAIAETDPALRFPPGTVKRAAMIFGLFFGLYVSSYVVLSLFGAYAPVGGGPHTMQTGGPWKQIYWWAPHGFYEAAPSNWPEMPRFLYSPLWEADIRFWHTSEAFERSGGPHYPEWSDQPRP